MMTAAPVIRDTRDRIGAPGMTDFISIYIDEDLSKSEYRTVLRHEQAHVWAGHNRRCRNEYSKEEWKLSCELEIARNIYDDRDILTITSPRSRLEGAVLPNSIPNLPVDIIFAEDIYEWLMENRQESESESMCACEPGNKDNCGDNEPCNSGSDEDSRSKILEARIALDDLEAKVMASEKARAEYEKMIYRKPTLVDVVDSELRVRAVRERTYRRNPRREVSGLLTKGRITTPRPPLVEIYVDRSGSFTPQKTATAEKRLAEILSRYGSSIHSDVFFFGNGKISHEDPGGGGDTPYNLIIENLKRTNPKIAIVITDDDPCEALDKIKCKIICIPIECTQTNFAKQSGAVDVL